MHRFCLQYYIYIFFSYSIEFIPSTKNIYSAHTSCRHFVPPLASVLLSHTPSKEFSFSFSNQPFIRSPWRRRSHGPPLRLLFQSHTLDTSRATFPAFVSIPNNFQPLPLQILQVAQYFPPNSCAPVSTIHPIYRGLLK